MEASFIKARPVWAIGCERDKNLTLGFRFDLNWDGQATVCLRLAASSLYRFFVNGVFAGSGPVRGPHGFYRIDAWELADLLQPGANSLAIEVAGYNINSFYLLDQPAFLQAEVQADGRVLAATGADCSADEGWLGCRLPERIQKVQRYSYQRTFAESYSLAPEYSAWRNRPVKMAVVRLMIMDDKPLITGNLPPFTYPAWPVQAVVETGKADHLDQPARAFRDRALTQISDQLKGFPENELSVHLTDEAAMIGTCRQQDGGALPLGLTGDAYALLDFGINKTGFIDVSLSCTENATVYLLFDEILTNGDVDFTRMSCCNVVKYELQAGDYQWQTFEPYTMKYLKIIIFSSGASVIRKVDLREVTCSLPIQAAYPGTDSGLRRIFAAAVETFRQNCTDLYMDCPSRERAGWLCDSFFTARVEYALTGGTAIEHNFLENYLLPDRYPQISEGMLPMCYPSDHYNGSFIPNWALWFVIELEEYLDRSGDRTLVDALQVKVNKLFAYFQPFLNESGILEKLERWVFVEWSKANALTQDVNFPTNMLYAAALDAAGRLYRNAAFRKQAAQVRQTILAMSYDGAFFVDNAVRQNGQLVLTGERTETCQYYAFFFNVATPETHPELWRILTERFGPQRQLTGDYPEIYPANAFIGNYLRLDCLSRYGLREKMRNEIAGYFTYMVDITGTLWENTTATASCNHGFASYTAWLLLQP